MLIRVDTTEKSGSRIMRKSIASVMFIGCCMLVATSGQAQQVTMEAGTVVPVQIMENIHSSFNTQGEVVYMQVAEEVRIDGMIVIPKGARVEAEVGNVQGTGMLGKSGGVNFFPTRILAADGQWLALDPTNFGDQGDGAGVGAVIFIGIFAKGRPGFVPLGTRYRVTIRRDTEVETDILASAREAAVADVTMSGSVEKISTIKTKKSKPGRDIKMVLNIPPEIAPELTTGATNIEVVSFNTYVPEQPVQSRSVNFDSQKSTLEATFDWWSIIRYAQPGSNALVMLFELSDGRVAQADLNMSTTWKID
jgi:hypothetical protein